MALPGIGAKEIASTLYDEGDAVTAPGLEIQMLEKMEELPLNSPTRDPIFASLTEQLEARGGSQIFASAGQGRWVLPWVGGWERIWTNIPEGNYLGGPGRTSFSRRGVSLDQISARNFIYGPGEGGITIEYLHAVGGDSSAPIKVLLSRPGTVTNLGENVFQLDFDQPMNEYEVVTNKETGQDRLLNPDGKPLSDAGGERGGPTNQLLVRTTYLSEKMWILRDAKNTDNVAVFQRTDTRSVTDRRGLVADGQLKPPDDETIRYGRLLFGETLSDYSGWDAKTLQAIKEKEKILGAASGER